MFYILVLCLIKGQPIVFQDQHGLVVTIDGTVQYTMHRLQVQVNDVLLVDADGTCCQPHAAVINNINLRILLTPFPGDRADRRWMTQDVHDEYASYVVGPWLWHECVVTSFVIIL